MATTYTIPAGTIFDSNSNSNPCSMKTEDEFRNYTDSSRQSVVENHYKQMRENQSVAFVKKMHQKYDFSKPPRAVMTVRDAFRKLESYVDSSDPDTKLPNFVHSIQTAEGIRADGKPDWFQLVGLLHDMGKIMFLWGNPEDGQVGTSTGPQWALGGDTWVVGCKIPDSVVFSEYNESNPDFNDPVFSTELGMYESSCGLNNLLFAYGHDEYMYQMLTANKCSLPAEALAMVRFHSAYPWHTAKEYKQFMNENDVIMMESVLEFNKYDLYTKKDDDSEHLTFEQVESLWPYYQAIIDKYLPCDKEGGLTW